MNVLSLFDGISCGQVALERAGIYIDNYFASEIKPHAIKVTQHHYPKTIQLGDVRTLDTSKLPKIDLMLFGSPCQDLSQANANRLGLSGNKSSLFCRAYEILQEVKPTYFLMENVEMKGADLEEISQCLGTYPINICSSLVSAQTRNRFYWTNIGESKANLLGERICNIPQPKDQKIKFQDILTSGFTDRAKARCLLASGGGTGYKSMEKMYRRYKEIGFSNIVFEDESLDWSKGIRKLNITEMGRLQTLPEGYLSILNYNQAQDVAGDGWTVDVIAHIFSYLPYDKLINPQIAEIIDEHFMELI
jgi:DNA (cytosine-5)-methyltransferase 3A